MSEHEAIETKAAKEIGKEITVRNKHGDVISKTYLRRAIQLVKKDRAVWIGKDRTEIILLPNTSDSLVFEPNEIEKSLEEKNMDEHNEMHISNSNGEQRSEYKIVDDMPTGYESKVVLKYDADIYKAATERLIERKRLIMSWFTYIFGFFAFFIVAAIITNGFWNHGFITSSLIAMLVAFFVLGGLYCTKLTFNYFTKVTPDKIQKEYDNMLRKTRR